MVLSVLLKVIYPPPASIFVTAMSVLCFVSMSNGGWKEFKGKNMQYSKFVNTGSNSNDQEEKDNNNKKKKPKVVPSKIGMILAYTPSLLVGVSSFFIFPVGAADLRFTLVRSAITAHFLKRVLEVLFVHKYSGSMNFEDAIFISLSYFTFSVTAIYAQYLTTPLPKPIIDLKYIGVPMFLLGLSGNLYHHYLLSKLRTSSEKQYKIPQGGLFNLVICPHYLFEIIGFFGMSCISQTLYTLSFTMGSTFCLMGRSYATRNGTSLSLKISRRMLRHYFLSFFRIYFSLIKLFIM